MFEYLFFVALLIKSLKSLNSATRKRTLRCLQKRFGQRERSLFFQYSISYRAQRLHRMNRLRNHVASIKSERVRRDIVFPSLPLNAQVRSAHFNVVHVVKLVALLNWFDAIDYERVAALYFKLGFSGVQRFHCWATQKALRM